MHVDVADGWWWLPGRESDRRFGRLSAGASGPWTLDVYGSLDNREDTSRWLFAATDELATAPVIHGDLLKESPGRGFVSLVDCWQTSSANTVSGVARGGQTEIWTFQEVVCGPDTVAPDAAASTGSWPTPIIMGENPVGVEVMDEQLDLIADLNAEGDDGLGWSTLADASHSERVVPGAMLLAGNRYGQAVVGIVAVDDDGQVHFTILPGAVSKNRHLLGRTVA